MKVCARRPSLDLVAELAHEDVDGPVAVRLPAAPDLLEQLVARDHPAVLERERVEEPELGWRQLDALAVDVRLDVSRVDPELLDLDRLAALRRPGRERRAGPPTRTRATSSFIEKGFTR